MVEPILYASLGALLATLICLLFLPVFWRRAVRLTTRRLVDRLPVSASEIIAAQDRLRAEQAMAMRVVERKAESSIGEATRDRVDSARARATELGHLADISDLRAHVAALENEGARVRGELDKTGKEAAAAYDALQEARAAAVDAQRELQAVRQEASGSRAATDQARMEISAREAEIHSLRARLLTPDAAAQSIKAPAENAAEPADQPTPVGPATTRMPKADFALAFPPAPDASPKPAASVAEAAELADLRRRLDEVADAIVNAADRPEPTAKPAPSTKRPRMPQVERAGA